jgi:S1-C subfamily serine protease
VAGRAFPVLLDSGYTGSLALPEATALIEGRPVSANLLSLADRFVGSRTARASGDMALAGIAFRRPILELLPSGEGLLGLEVLRHFTVRIDTAAKVAHFQSKRTEPVTVPGIRSLGFAFSPTPAGLRIEAVLDEGPGRDGLRRGDVLTHLDGEPAARTWQERLPELLNDGRSSIAARRLRGGRSQDLTLRITTLLE